MLEAKGGVKGVVVLEGGHTYARMNGYFEKHTLFYELRSYVHLYSVVRWKVDSCTCGNHY